MGQMAATDTCAQCCCCCCCYLRVCLCLCPDAQSDGCRARARRAERSTCVVEGRQHLQAVSVVRERRRSRGRKGGERNRRADEATAAAKRAHSSHLSLIVNRDGRRLCDQRSVSARHLPQFQIRPARMHQQARRCGQAAVSHTHAQSRACRLWISSPTALLHAEPLTHALLCCLLCVHVACQVREGASGRPHGRRASVAVLRGGQSDPSVRPSRGAGRVARGGEQRARPGPRGHERGAQRGREEDRRECGHQTGG